jgi:hypothetical protein
MDSPYLGKTEEYINGHDGQEDTKDDVHFPLDLDEGWRDEVRQRKVEDPTCGCGKSHRFASNTQRI